MTYIVVTYDGRLDRVRPYFSIMDTTRPKETTKSDLEISAKSLRATSMSIPN